MKKNSKKRKENRIDLSNIKIITTLQYLGIIFGFVFTIGTIYSNFISMKSDLSELKFSFEKSQTDLGNKILNAQIETSRNIKEVSDRISNLEGQLKIVLKNP